MTAPSVNPTTPLRLDDAAKMAFPDGSMGAAGLRKERDAGRLVTELVAGKEYTTLADIQKMREQCRGLRKGRGSTGAKRAGKPTGTSGTMPGGSSETGTKSLAWAAAKQAAQKLKKRSVRTSSKNTNPAESGTVIPIK